MKYILRVYLQDPVFKITAQERGCFFHFAMRNDFFLGYGAHFWEICLLTHPLAK